MGDPDEVEIKLKLYPVHVYRAHAQPLTLYVVHAGDRSATFTNPPGTYHHTSCCRRRRQARHLVIRVYYDASVISCAPGRGCKR